MDFILILICLGFVFTIVRYLIIDFGGNNNGYGDNVLPPVISGKEIIFSGSNTKITAQEIHTTLLKHHSYYGNLAIEGKKKFIRRVQNFMYIKTFIIKDDEVYKSMPILSSAAAVQLTFGLKDYLLPYYNIIRIFPGEYFADHSFRVLAGNVKGRTISIAWNHFLDGYANVNDGSNVGLHEMSHALYCQKLIVEKNYAKDFCRKYDELHNECKEAYKIEIDGGRNFYSAYADTDLQEFWAESVELFFEKPEDMQSHYPTVFDAMRLLLNQDPRNKTEPVFEKQPSINNRLEKFFR